MSSRYTNSLDSLGDGPRGCAPEGRSCSGHACTGRLAWLTSRVKVFSTLIALHAIRVGPGPCAILLVALSLRALLPMNRTGYVYAARDESALISMEERLPCPLAGTPPVGWHGGRVAGRGRRRVGWSDLADPPAVCSGRSAQPWLDRGLPVSARQTGRGQPRRRRGRSVDSAPLPGRGGGAASLYSLPVWIEPPGSGTYRDASALRRAALERRLRGAALSVAPKTR